MRSFLHLESLAVDGRPGPRRGQNGDRRGEALVKTRRFLAHEHGPTALEYAVMLALIVVVSMVAIDIAGSLASNLFAPVDSALTQDR